MPARRTNPSSHHHSQLKPPTSLKRLLPILILLPVITTLGCGDADDPDAELDRWKQNRANRLAEAWVSLAGLYWIDGDQLSIGSGPDNDVRFPEDAPLHVGTMTRSGEGALFTAADDVEALVNGSAAQQVELATDRVGDPTEVTVGPWRWYLIERQGRIALRLHDQRAGDAFSPADLSYYPTSADWRLDGRFTAYPADMTIPVPTVLGTIEEMRTPGYVEFNVDGRELRLDVLEGGADTYFVMFADSTNRVDTYEAGRYLYIDHEDADGRVLLDFNKSYNPPCAFTPYATCPFPPEQNYLPLSVTSGEKRYAKNVAASLGAR